MPATKPLILITPDIETKALRRGPCDHFVLDHHYADAVLAAGGIPFVAPYTEDEDVIRGYVAHCQGIVLTGGDFDVDPALFGAQPHPSLGTLKPRRTLFEQAIHDLAMKEQKPTLGICGGMQLMCVLREGGTLWQDLGSEREEETLNHEQAAPKSEPGHTVDVVPDTLFAKLCGEDTLGVNTTHHQAIRSLGKGLVPSAAAPDGVVEALEDPSLPFWLGVQWHPEAMPDLRHQSLYLGLVEEARKGMR